jgi:hypothetical protein
VKAIENTSAYSLARERRCKLGDVALPLAACLSLGSSCYLVNREKIFWNDELFSWYLLADPSFSNMLGAFHDHLNATPPLYFLLGWLWAQVFGAAELSLRLFSSLGFCLALIFVWLFLRRAYGFWASAFAVLLVFCTSTLILYQNAEARMYGLYLAAAAAAIWAHQRVDQEKGVLFALFLSHVALIHSHLHGAFFSGAILFVAALRDRFSSQWRPKAYGAVLAAWLSFLLYLPSLLVHMELSQPRGWLPEPISRDLFGYFLLGSTHFNPAFLTPVLLSAPFLLFVWPAKPARGAEKRAQASLLLFALGLALVPIAVWVFSIVVQPLFMDRYLLPATLAYAILLAHAFDTLLSHEVSSLDNGVSATQRWRLLAFFKIIWLAAALYLLSIPIQYGKHYTGQGAYKPGIRDDEAGHLDLPIVVQTSQLFLERRQYAPQSERYVFILDEAAAMTDASGAFGPQEYKHMLAFRRHYPRHFTDQIVESEVFLEKHPRFLVLDFEDYTRACLPKPKGGLINHRLWENTHCPQWLEMRIINNPDYRVRPLTAFSAWEQMLLVEKVDRRSDTDNSELD